MTSQINIGTLVALGLLTSEDAKLLMDWDAEFAWQMPALVAESITVYDAIQLARRKLTLCIMQGVSYLVPQRVLLQLVQSLELAPRHQSTSVRHVEHLVGVGTNHGWVVVPYDTETNDLRVTTGADDLYIEYRALDYAAMRRD